MDVERIRRGLVELIGADRVHWDDAALDAHDHDWWYLSTLHRVRGTHDAQPACVVMPQTAEDVAAVLHWASAHRVPVVPFGAGSGVCGGVRPSRDAVVVDMRRMDALIDVDDVGLTADVQAGKMGDVLETELNAQGFTLGHFPQSIALSTVGGWIATRAAGQASTRYGNIEDIVLGLEAVLPDGRIVRFDPGPRRAAGPDLRHLFLGAEGTLGIVTEARLRLVPQPEYRELHGYAFTDFGAGLEAIRACMRQGWRPPVVRLYDAFESERHFAGLIPEHTCALVLVSEGPKAMVMAEAAGCGAACEAAGGRQLGPAPAERWLAKRNEVPTFEALIAQGLVADTIEVASGWERIHELYREVCNAVRAVADVLVVSGHSSHSYAQGTNIYFTFVARPQTPEAFEPTYLACWRAAMDGTLRAGGTIAHHHGIGRVRLPWMAQEHGEALTLLRDVKRALDPAGIMNPGVLIPDDV